MNDVMADMSLQESCKDAARHMSVEVHLLADAADKLEQENAKLRELVKDIYEDMWDSGEWLEPYEQRMRELGMEVDG